MPGLGLKRFKFRAKRVVSPVVEILNGGAAGWNGVIQPNAKRVGGRWPIVLDGCRTVVWALPTAIRMIRMDPSRKGL